MLKNHKKRCLANFFSVALFCFILQARAGDSWLHILIPSFEGKHYCKDKVIDAHAVIDVACRVENIQPLRYSMSVRRDEPFLYESTNLNYKMDNETKYFTTVIYFTGPINLREPVRNYFVGHWNKGLEGSVMEFEGLRQPDDFLQDFVGRKTMQIRMENACGGMSYLYFDIDKVGDTMLASSRVCNLREMMDKKRTLRPAATAH